MRPTEFRLIRINTSSVLMMCETCNAKNLNLWGPVPRPPKLSETRNGNWISLVECPECKQLWTTAPFEPYAAFEYMVKWPLGIDDWNRIHDRDEGRTMHDWLINEIRRFYRTASTSVRAAIESHEQRSYGHYGLTKSVSTNPVSLQPE